MCVDGSCGHFTKPGEDDEVMTKFNALLAETADGIAARLPREMPPFARGILAAVMTAGIVSNAMDEINAERDAPRDMVADDLGAVAA